MMVSSFQFSNPSLINLSFSVNEDFSMKDNERTDIDVMTEISIKDGLEKNSSMVLLKLEIGSRGSSSPFYIQAEEVAIFNWDADAIDESQRDKLLKQNAPALLLSYLRPTIAMITSASPYASYNVPFMNFSEKK